MPEGSLVGRVAGGLAWKGASQVLLNVLRLGLAVLLARLLTPRDFGVAGMVLVFAAFVIPFADVGLGAAFVQRSVLGRKDAPTLFWTSIVAGTAFTLLGVAVSGSLASFYGEPGVQPLFAVLSLTFMITALGATHRSLLVRDLNFRSLELRLLAGTFAGAAVALVVALRGHGPWAFVALELTVASVSTVLLWALSPWRPSFAYSTASLRALAGFGTRSLGARLLGDVNQLADKLLIGRFLGATPLGLYTLSYNLVLIPFNRVVAPLQEVLFPALSRIQDDARRMGGAWLRAIRLVAAVALPAMLGLIAVTPEFISTVLGERWLPAVRVVQILAVVGLLQSIVGLNHTVLQAAGRTSTLLRFALLTTALNVSAFVVGLRWGIVGVAVAYAASTALVVPLYFWATARTLELPLADVAGTVSGVAQAAALMLTVVVAMKLGLAEAGVGDAARLVAVVATGAGLWIPLLAWRAPDVLADLRRLLSRRGRQAAPLEPYPSKP